MGPRIYLIIFDFSPDLTISLFMGVPYFALVYGSYHVIPDYKRLIVFLMIGILFFDVAIQIFLSVNGLTIFDHHISINNLDYIGLISQLIGVSVSINFVYNLKHI